jgi:hypothetical protein
MVTGWFDFTLVCVVLRLMQTVDVFFIGGDWKKFRADYCCISFSTLAEANPDKCCFGRCRKIFNAKNAGKLHQCLFGVFFACVSREQLLFLSGAPSGKSRF